MADLAIGVTLTPGSTYKISFRVSGFIGSDAAARIHAYQGTQLIFSISSDTAPAGGNFVADGSGNTITFSPTATLMTATVDSVSVCAVTQAAVSSNFSVKYFLSGSTDEGRPIFFRADTQYLQLSKNFETFSSPLAVVSRVQKGTLLKCFVAIDEGDFYELEGTVSKGVSIVKVHAQGRRKMPTPPLARKVRVSWRDGSAQLCRLIQGAIVFIPGTMDYSE